MAPIKVFTLGHTGVIIDANPFEPSKLDDSLQLSQNAEHDPRAGHLGALRKRAGWARFNAANAGGAILGGIPMPVAEFGGAPSSGGGALIGTGDDFGGTPPGSGDGTGSPGGTTDGQPRATPNPGPGSWNPPFANERVVVIARNGTGAPSDSGGAGWFVTSKNLTQATTTVTTPGFGGPYGYPAVAPFDELWGTPGCVLNGKLYYAGNHGSQVTGSASPIRINTGATDSLFTTIPVSTDGRAFVNYPTLSGAKRQAIVAMRAGSDGNIYIAVKDKFYGQNTNGNAGRVFRLSPTTGALTQMLSEPTMLPYCVEYFDGHVFQGSYIPQAVANQLVTVVATSSDELHAVVDRSFGSTDASMISCMTVWKNTLVVGVGCYQTGSGVESGSYLATIHLRFQGGSLGDTANWNAINFDTARTGRGVNGNVVVSSIVFNGDLYVSWYSPGGAGRVYRFTCVDDTLTSSSALVDTLVLNSNRAFTLFVDDGVLYAVGGSIGVSSKVFVTPDGTTWTDKSAQISGGSYVLPVLFGVDQ